jgi:16S rRNA A1518/A1519 N6-dimethyltransferase RsmA/KsgA/DIM1 with predicted DNA glycosylase/AP lyase activity
MSSKKIRVLRGHAGHGQLLHKRIRFAQNFLNKKNLAASLVSQSNICAQDIVYEIGAGTGVITEALAQVASKVIAIEIDPSLAKHLKNKFQVSKWNNHESSNTKTKNLCRPNQ